MSPVSGAEGIQGKMTVLDDVRDLIIRCDGAPICDDGISDNLKLSVRQHANRKTNILKNEHGFHRRKGRCPICRGDKLVIRHS